MAETVSGVNTTTTEAVDGVEIKVPMEVYSRIVGYLRPIQNWNAGKQQEFSDRVVYRVPNDLPKAKPRALLVAPFEAKL